MKKAGFPILLIVISVAIYFIVLGQSFKQQIEFNGQTYKYNTNLDNKGIVVHIYRKTPYRNSRTNYMHIIEFKKEIAKSMWLYVLKRMNRIYNLEPIDENYPLQLSGGKPNYKAYATDITIGNKEYFIYYITDQEKHDEEEEDLSKDLEVIRGLKNLQFQ